jgi:hypothetical protein
MIDLNMAKRRHIQRLAVGQRLAGDNAVRHKPLVHDWRVHPSSALDKAKDGNGASIAAPSFVFSRPSPKKFEKLIILRRLEFAILDVRTEA